MKQSRRVSFCKIEFNKCSVKPSELCQVTAENLNERRHKY